MTHRPEFDPLIVCEQCKRIIQRQRYRGGELESMTRFRARKYCSPKVRDCLKQALKWDGPAYNRRLESLYSKYRDR